MTREEIKAYVDKIENSSLENVSEVLPSINLYNIDLIMSKICEVLAENINILRKLNNENDKNELNEEILELLKKYYICVHYLDAQAEFIHDSHNGHKVIFAKTPAGNPYFKIDLNNVPTEVYGEVKSTLNGILNGIDMSDNTKFKYYSGSDYSQKILEFKGFQVRIFTTKLKGNILCVIGLDIKKSDCDKKINSNLRKRLSTARKHIESLRKAMNDPTQKQELLLDSEIILNDIMNILNKGVVEDVEMLFPSDEELESLVPYNEISLNNEENNLSENLSKESLDSEILSNEMVESVEKKSLTDNTTLLDGSITSGLDSPIIPSTSKKVKRRGRGLGKKTIARNQIMVSLKGLNLEELMKIQNFITKLKMNKDLNETIGNIYEGFYNMSDEQIREFENSIKYFKYDDVGRSK